MEKTEVSYPDSNRVGKFNILHEVLAEGRSRPMLQALFGCQMVVLDVYENESGRGKTYIAASQLFQELVEGEEIPDYRIESVCDMPFPDPAHEARRLNNGHFGFVAIRKIIIRVPPLQMSTRAHAIH